MLNYTYLNWYDAGVIGFVLLLLLVMMKEQKETNESRFLMQSCCTENKNFWKNDGNLWFSNAFRNFEFLVSIHWARGSNIEARPSVARYGTTESCVRNPGDLADPRHRLVTGWSAGIQTILVCHSLINMLP